MANPFQAKFDSKCQLCGETVEEGEEMWAIGGQFLCSQCVSVENQCDCGNYKGDDYETCYDCSGR